MPGAILPALDPQAIVEPPIGPDSDDLPARASVPDAQPAVEEVDAEALRQRWLATGAPPPTVTYVAAPPPAGRRARPGSITRRPGTAQSPALVPHRPAAPAPGRAVMKTAGLLRACARRGGGRHVLLLIATPGMLMLLLAGAFVLGTRQAGGAHAPAPIAPAQTAAQTAPPASTVVAPEPSPPAAAAVISDTPTPAAATTPAPRVAVRLSCTDTSSPLNLTLDLATAEVIAVGSNRCAGWFLIQAHTVVSWVKGPVLLSDGNGPAATRGEAP